MASPQKSETRGWPALRQVGAALWLLLAALSIRSSLRDNRRRGDETPSWIEDDYYVAAFSATALLLWYAVCKPYVDAGKSRSWLIGLMTSAVLCVVATFFAQNLASVMSTAVTAGANDATVSAAWTRVAFSEDHWLSRPTLIFFNVSLLLDIGVGWFEYRDQIHPLTGWIHHSVYILLGSWLLQRGWASSLVAFSANELPTLLLALGSVNKAWRTDLPFGIAYFLTRICMTIAAWYMHWRFNHISNAAWMIMTPIVMLHCHWFRGWLISYGKTRRAASATRDIPAAAATTTSKESIATTNSGGVVKVNGDGPVAAAVVDPSGQVGSLIGGDVADGGEGIRRRPSVQVGTSGEK